MCSRRVSHSPVLWLHKFISPRCLILILLILTTGAAFGFVGVSVRWGNPGKVQQASPEPALSHAATTSRVSMAKADISMTAVKTVSAASYDDVAVAPDSIVTAYGVGLATVILAASDVDPSTPGFQLPKQLGGTTVEVEGRKADLFFVSPLQINYVIPPETPRGLANVVVRSGDGTISQGTVQIVEVVPSIFTANASGSGVPAATLLRVKADNSRSFEELSTLNPNPNPDGSNRDIPKVLDLGTDSDKGYSVLYATGVRRRTNIQDVHVLVGGEEAVVEYAGPQPDFAALDQINAIIPRSLIGKGPVNVSVSVTGFTTSNEVNINIGEAVGNAPPKGFGFPTPALAGSPLEINGTGFFPLKGDNTVLMGDLNADVMQAAPTKLTVMVPFGVESGPVRVRTKLGVGVSLGDLTVRTSISGYVQNTLR